MISKVYEKTKTFIKENYLFFLGLIVIIFLMTFKLPYYISAPGGLINTSSRIDITSDFEMEGSLTMAYVTEMDGIIPMLVIAFFNKNWDVETEAEVTTGSESIEDVQFRNKLLLEEANSTAMKVAYDNSDISYKKENSKTYVTYVDDLAQTTLEVRDQIIEVNGEKIKEKNDVYDILGTKKIGDKVKFKVINDDKEYNREATLIDVQGEAKIGILVSETYDLKSDYNIDLTFKGTESGSSGGLMMTLTVYSYLNKIDLTGGKTIVGTGTIDEEGNVGEISGVKYKLIGAYKKGADIFLVPRGDNYKEAKRVKKENGYDITLVPVSTFEEALEYLENN